MKKKEGMAEKVGLWVYKIFKFLGHFPLYFEDFNPWVTAHTTFHNTLLLL